MDMITRIFGNNQQQTNSQQPNQGQQQQQGQGAVNLKAAIDKIMKM